MSKVDKIKEPIATIDLGGTFHTFDTVQDVFEFMDIYFKDDELEHITKIWFSKYFFWRATKRDINCEFTNSTGVEIADTNSWRLLNGEILKRKINRKTEVYHINIINAKS